MLKVWLSYLGLSKKTRAGQEPPLDSQRARRGILMPRGKNCRETIFAAHLPRNYPRHGAISLSFRSLIFWFLSRKTLKFTKDCLSLPNPQIPWKRKRKRQNNQGNSLLKINQGNPKNQGTEGQGLKEEKNVLYCGGGGNLGGILRDNFGEGNWESNIAARQWESIIAARHQDDSQGPLGSHHPWMPGNSWPEEFLSRQVPEDSLR